MTSDHSSKYAPKTRNPRSEIPVQLRNRQFGRHVPDSRARGRDTSTDYPCPVCKQTMYKDEEISFGTIALPDGDKHTGKHHTVCPEL